MMQSGKNGAEKFPLPLDSHKIVGPPCLWHLVVDIAATNEVGWRLRDQALQRRHGAMQTPAGDPQAALELLGRNQHALEALATALFGSRYLDRADIQAILVHSPLATQTMAVAPAAPPSETLDAPRDDTAIVGAASLSSAVKNSAKEILMNIHAQSATAQAPTNTDDAERLARYLERRLWRCHQSQSHSAF